LNLLVQKYHDSLVQWQSLDHNCYGIETVSLYLLILLHYFATSVLGTTLDYIRLYIQLVRQFLTKHLGILIFTKSLHCPANHCSVTCNLEWSYETIYVYTWKCRLIWTTYQVTFPNVRCVFIQMWRYTWQKIKWFLAIVSIQNEDWIFC